MTPGSSRLPCGRASHRCRLMRAAVTRLARRLQRPCQAQRVRRPLFGISGRFGRYRCVVQKTGLASPPPRDPATPRGPAVPVRVDAASLRGCLPRASPAGSRARTAEPRARPQRLGAMATATKGQDLHVALHRTHYDRITTKDPAHRRSSRPLPYWVARPCRGKAPPYSRPALGRNRVLGCTERQGGWPAADAAGALRSDGRVGPKLPSLWRMEVRQGDLGLKSIAGSPAIPADAHHVHRRARFGLARGTQVPGQLGGVGPATCPRADGARRTAPLTTPPSFPG